MVAVVVIALVVKHFFGQMPLALISGSVHLLHSEQIMSAVQNWLNAHSLCRKHAVGGIFVEVVEVLPNVTAVACRAVSQRAGHLALMLLVGMQSLQAVHMLCAEQNSICSKGIQAMRASAESERLPVKRRCDVDSYAKHAAAIGHSTSHAQTRKAGELQSQLRGR